MDKKEAKEQKVEQNELVMASDDDISISSMNDQCLFSKVSTPMLILSIPFFSVKYITRDLEITLNSAQVKNTGQLRDKVYESFCF